MTIALWSLVRERNENIVDETRYRLTFQEIWERLLLVLHGELDQTGEKIITNVYGEVTPNRVGRILSERLHGQKETITQQGRLRRVYTFQGIMLRRALGMYCLRDEDLVLASS